MNPELRDARGTPATTAKEIEGLKEKLLLAERERDEYLAGWKRAKADLANFRRETSESVARLHALVLAGFLKHFVPVLEAFEQSEKNRIEGLKPIADLVRSILQKEGVETIEPAVGEAFNPELHEALKGEGDTIVEMLQRGYRFGDAVLKPAHVVVGDRDPNNPN